MKEKIVNNREKSGWLFPFASNHGFRHTRGPGPSEHVLRSTGRVLSAMERSLTVFIGALPVADIAFVILVVAYVKAS